MCVCIPMLLQQACLVGVEDINDVAQLVNGIKGGIVSLISFGLFKDDQAASTLIQNANNDSVENHLAELVLDLSNIQTDHLGNVVNLDAAEWLNDLDQVLFKHVVVEAA